MSAVFGAPARDRFGLAGDAVFLNHGSFGAPPLEVMAAQSQWRAQMEREPDVFFRRLLRPGLRAAAEVFAPTIGVAGEDIAFVENATTAISTVLQRLSFSPGDEILLTDTTYNAVKLAVAHECRRSGAVPRIVSLPFPYASDDEVLDCVLSGATAKTRLAILDHIVSPTAFVLPIARLAAGLRARGVRVLIDGAHAPGQIALDVPSLAADWVTGNLHKWFFCPRGTAYLWAAPSARAMTLPLNISHDAALGFPRAFDYTGTRDSTAWLCAPDALSFIADYGLDRIMAHNQALAQAAAARFAQLGAVPAAPPAQFASMVSLFLPTREAATPEEALLLLNAMWDRRRVQIAASAVHGRLLLRVSAQIYCTLADVEAAVAALDELGWPHRV